MFYNYFIVRRKKSSSRGLDGWKGKQNTFFKHSPFLSTNNLNLFKINCKYYNFNAFKVPVITATISFGMGVDKASVR